MRLTRNTIDVGIFTNHEADQLAFWQEQAGLPFESTSTTSAGLQRRHGMNGSIFKLNLTEKPVPAGGWTGYRELFIAREGLSEPVTLADPDGNPVTLVPAGHDGIDGIGVRLAVSDAAAFDRFFRQTLGLERVGERRYRWGDSVLWFEQDAAAGRADDDRRTTPGYRYITVHVEDCDAAYNEFVERGAEGFREPQTLRGTVRVGFIRDPDGNHIEIAQRLAQPGA